MFASAATPFHQKKTTSSDSETDLESGSSAAESSEDVQASRPAQKEDLCCFGYIDKRPWLPVGLYASTVAGGIFVLSNLKCRAAFVAALLLYVVCLASTLRAALMDPGQMDGDGQETMPKRSHRSWQYGGKIVRRYDHYCRWVANTIGLRNHREFILILLTLTAIALLGVANDVYMAVELYFKDQVLSPLLVPLVLHFVYSVNLLLTVGPITRTHLGLVARNELCQEWKRDQFYVVNIDGVDVPVCDLDEEDHDQHCEHFTYEKSRNPWDQGAGNNCLKFWFSTRLADDSTGEF